tara:strand:+ start:2316 stop:2627 length:312 start_codon:yes stop_codon:yes gene_type:complete
VTYIERDPETDENLYDYYVDEMGVKDTSVSVSDSGFELLSIKLEELFDLFGYTRFDTSVSVNHVMQETYDGSLYGLTDEMESDFCDIRNDLIDIFNKGKEVQS